MENEKGGGGEEKMYCRVSIVSHPLMAYNLLAAR